MRGDRHQYGEQRLTISELSKHTGISVSLLSWWASRGELSPERVAKYERKRMTLEMANERGIRGSTLRNRRHRWGDDYEAAVRPLGGRRRLAAKLAKVKVEAENV
jgi:hypothetical protein